MRYFLPRLISVLCILFTSIQADQSLPGSRISVSSQLGPHPVSIFQHVVNTFRPDPLAPSPQNRSILTTIYRPFTDRLTCPSEYQSTFPYIPQPVAAALLTALSSDPTSPQSIAAATNESQIFQYLELVNCSLPFSTSPASDQHILLFSPGYGGTHDVYAHTLVGLASSGYTIVAIDHTYEAAAMVFPNGQVIPISPATEVYDSTQAGELFLQAIRVNDSISILDAIEGGELPGLGLGNSPAGLQAAMFGHSFGGSTAINVALQDPRVIASLSMDGPVYAISNATAITKPVLWMQSEDASAGAATDGWTEFIQNSDHGWKSRVLIKNTVHYGFTDLPILADLLDIRGTVVPLNLTGTANSRRLEEIVWRYSSQFFDYVFGGTCPSLLKGPSRLFPDVTFLGHSAAKVNGN